MANTVLQDTDKLPLQPVLFSLTGPVLHRLADADRRPDAVDHPGGRGLRPDAEPVRRRDDPRRGQVAPPSPPLELHVLDLSGAPRTVPARPPTRQRIARACPSRTSSSTSPTWRAPSTSTPGSSRPQVVGEPDGRPRRARPGHRHRRAARRRRAPVASTWVPDDLQRGFRHVGFKVDRSTRGPRLLKAAEVPFHLDPLDAEGGVRICFFYDPDGTLLELVEGDLQYAAVLDPDGVAAERALGVPTRPRFDHVALTVADRGGHGRVLRVRSGSRLLGTIEQPHDPRGFDIGYLKSGAHRSGGVHLRGGGPARHPAARRAGLRLRGAGRGSPPTERLAADPVRRERLRRPRRFPLRRSPAPSPRVTAPGRADWLRPLGSTGLDGTARRGRRRAAGQHAGELRPRGDSTTTGCALVAATCWTRPCGCSTPRTATATARASAASGPRSPRRGGLPADFVVTTKVDARGRDYSGARVRASVAEIEAAAGPRPPAAGVPARPRVPRLQRR